MKILHANADGHFNDLKIGDYVILTDFALKEYFGQDLNHMLFGRIVQDKKELSSDTVTVKNAFDGEDYLYSQYWLKKGQLDDEYLLKVRNVIEGIINDYPLLILHIYKGKDILKKYLNFFDLPIPKEIDEEPYERRIQDHLKTNQKGFIYRDDLSEYNDALTYLYFELGKLFKGDILKQKIKEADIIAWRLREYIVELDNNLELLYSFVVETYKYDIKNNTCLDNNDRLFFALMLTRTYLYEKGNVKKK